MLLLITTKKQGGHYYAYQNIRRFFISIRKSRKGAATVRMKHTYVYISKLS